jgi:hypothetical protein
MYQLQTNWKCDSTIANSSGNQWKEVLGCWGWHGGGGLHVQLNAPGVVNFGPENPPSHASKAWFGAYCGLVCAIGLLWDNRDPSSNKLGGMRMGIRCLVGGGGLTVLTWGPIPYLLSSPSNSYPPIYLSVILLLRTHLWVRCDVVHIWRWLSGTVGHVIMKCCCVWTEFETPHNSNSDFNFNAPFFTALLKSQKYLYMLSTYIKTLLYFQFE